MESLVRFADYIANRVRSLPARSRLVVLLCSAAVLFGIVVFANRTTSQAKMPLFDGQTFSFRELADMMAAFTDANLPDAKIVGNQIHVPWAEHDRYLVALQATGALPMAIDESVDQAAAGSSLFASPGEIQIAHQQAEEKKLARIVANMHGIEMASVQYDTIKKSGFPPTVDVRASVAVRAVGGKQLDYEQIEAIRDTVAGYIGGLDRADVTVTDLVACRAYPGSYDANDPLAASRAYATQQRLLEDEYREEIVHRLEMYPGVVVAVDVQLAMPTGVSAGLDSAPSGLLLTPTLVRASISLPQSLIEDVWRQRNRKPAGSIPRPDELLEVEQGVRGSIQQIVLAMLPPPALPAFSGEQVTVTSHWDSPTLAAGSGRNAPLGTLLAAYPWLTSLGILATIAASLGVTWRYRRSLSGGRSKGDSAGGILAAGPTDDPTSAEDAPDASEAEVQEAIAELVRQNPESAAKLIQNWLDKAA